VDDNRVVLISLTIVSLGSFGFSYFVVGLFFEGESTLRSGVQLILTLSLFTTFYAPLKLFIFNRFFRDKDFES
jgi:hypothetical protein